jgi:hypothetical protein
MLRTQTSFLQVDAIPVSAYQYCVYGVTLHSDIQLALPVSGIGELAQISPRGHYRGGAAHHFDRHVFQKAVARAAYANSGYTISAAGALPKLTYQPQTM